MYYKKSFFFDFHLCNFTFVPLSWSMLGIDQDVDKGRDLVLKLHEMKNKTIMVVFL